MSFYIGEIQEFLNNCKVIYSEDKYDFQDLKRRLSDSYEYIFYPCSHLDTKPIHLLEESKCRELTNDNLKERRIYLLSDTSKLVLDKLKYLYHNLDDIDSSKEKTPFNICSEPHTINEVIPLKVYGQDFVKRLMNSTIEEYVGKENCKNTNYSCNKLIKETLSVWNNWLDSEWHCVYINIEVDNKYNINMFIFPSDNIIVWKEVIEKYTIGSDPTEYTYDGTISNNIILTDVNKTISYRFYVTWNDSETASMDNVSDTLAAGGKAKIAVSINFIQLKN